MALAPRSPYELTAGSALDDLHPVVRKYVTAVPAGQRGYGHGVFEVVGSPRRWLRPLLKVLAAQNIAFPVWEKNVPFTVVNAPLIDRDGRTAVLAVRRFHLASGPATMIDAITAERADADGLVDHLGTHRLLRARLSARVVRGELHLQSTAFELRLGSRVIEIPALVAPQVTVVDRYDDTADGGQGAQRVTVRVDAPVIGRLYEYTGTFHYELRPEANGEVTDSTEGPDARGTIETGVDGTRPTLADGSHA